MSSTFRILRRLTNALALVLGLVAPALLQPGFSATISIGSGTGSPGSEIAIPIIISAQPDEAPSGVQVDIDFSDAPVSVNEVRAGEKATQAGKEVHSSSPQEGVLRILVIGLNQNVIDDGALAEVVFGVSNEANEGTHNLVCGNVVVTNPAGEPVPSDPVDGSLDIRSPSMRNFHVKKAKISQNKKTLGQKAKVIGGFMLESDKDLTQGIEITVGEYHEAIARERIRDKGKLWQYKRPKGAGKHGIKKLLIKWNKKGNIKRDALKFSFAIDDAQIFPGGIPPGSLVEVYIDFRIAQDLGDETIAMSQRKQGRLSYQNDGVKNDG